jgi:hypothetical protein
MAKPRLDQSAQDWIEACKRHRLSHGEIQITGELAMNPKRLGRIDNQLSPGAVEGSVAATYLSICI